MLVWISHYPVVSQQAWLDAYGLRYPGDLLNFGLANASLGLCRGPVLVLHGHMHTALVWRDGRILQIGVPAVVEWPHAWTEISIQLKGEAARVRAAIRSISGRWSAARVNTVLDKLDHAWVLVDERWAVAEAR